MFDAIDRSIFDIGKGIKMIRFSAINRQGSDGYNANLQRHHLLPLQAKSIPELRGPIEQLRRCDFRFDDWGSNGVLLPCDEQEAVDIGRPLHRGPHPRYNQLVLDRMIHIVRLGRSVTDERSQLSFLRLRISLLQAALRQGLLRSGIGNLTLNRRDPANYSAGYFDHLDDCVDRLYSQTDRTVTPDPGDRSD